VTRQASRQAMLRTSSDDVPEGEGERGGEEREEKKDVGGQAEDSHDSFGDPSPSLSDEGAITIAKKATSLEEGENVNENDHIDDSEPSKEEATVERDEESVMEKNNNMLSENDNDAPEEITLGQARQLVEETHRQVEHAVTSSKQRERQKRKEIDERNKKQRKEANQRRLQPMETLKGDTTEKLEKLPEALLEAIAEKEENEGHSTKKRLFKEASEESLSSGKKKKKKKKKEETLVIDPKEINGITVMSLETAAAPSQKSLLSRKAVDFRKKHFSGKRFERRDATLGLNGKLSVPYRFTQPK